MNDIHRDNEPGDDLFHGVPAEPVKTKPQPYFWSALLNKLAAVGLGEAALRAATAGLTLVMIVIVLYVMGKFYLPMRQQTRVSAVYAAGQAVITPAAVNLAPMVSEPENEGAGGVYRLTTLHTNMPAKPRMQVQKYTVVAGDTVFGIAEKFNLRPETVIWANYQILMDNPHKLSPGQELNILPVNGVYYEWHAGDGLNGVAEFYNVTPEAIVDYPGNGLSASTVGDYASPNIAVGTWLVIPGGTREYITWSAPRITRENPAVARVLGAGACAPITEGPIGVGVYVWPTTERHISGFNWSPETNHNGIDIGGKLGNPIFAADAGVVVYAGWNDWGYGNMVVVDHGNGWQTLYAHMSTLSVGCGSYVYGGDVLGAMGSTGNSSGPHLHFELRNESVRLDPRNFLQ